MDSVQPYLPKAIEVAAFREFKNFCQQPDSNLERKSADDLNRSLTRALSPMQPRNVLYWSAFVSGACDKSKIEEYKVTIAIAFATAVVAKCRNQTMFAMAHTACLRFWFIERSKKLL